MVSLSLLCPVFCKWQSSRSLNCHLLVVQLPQDTYATSNPIIPTEDLFRVTTAYLNCIATAAPEVHDAFVIFADQLRARERQQARTGQSECAMSFGPRLTAETIRIHGI